MTRYTPPFVAYVRGEKIIIADARATKIITMHADEIELSDAIEVARLMTLGAEAEEHNRKP